MKTDKQDIYFMEQALKLAKNAADLGEVPVGAVLVYNGEIVARACNTRQRHKDPIGHAEVLAIQQAAKQLGDWRLENHTLYVTLEPCPMCAGAIYLARITRCVFGAFDPKGGFLGSVFDINSVQELNHHFEVQGGVLEHECSNLLRNFFKKIREERRSKKGYGD